MFSGAVRNLIALALLGLAMASVAAISATRSDYRVGFGSLLAIWADFARDADQIGLAVTRISTPDEIKIGDQIVGDFYDNSDIDPRLTAYINAVGARLAEQGDVRRKDIVYRFHILDTPYVNAWALPGGHVFITTGLIAMAGSEAQVASILAHEMAHIDLRHVVERLQYEATLRRIVGDFAEIAQLAYSLVNVAYSSQQESEADRYGLLMMAEAGYAPTESIEIFASLEQTALEAQVEESRASGPVTEVVESVTVLLRDYFESHPATADRIVALMQLLSDNASGWTGRSFCIGRSNLGDRTVCAEGTRPAEWQELDLASPSYHLHVAVLLDSSGHLALADREFAAVLAASRDYWQAIRSRVNGELDDLSAVLTDLRSGILLLSAQVRLNLAGDDQAQGRITLGEEMGLHAALVSALERHDYVDLPASTADFSTVPFTILCQALLASDGATWRADRRLSDLVLEAGKRGYGPLGCRFGVAGPPDVVVSAGRSFHDLLRGGR